MACERMENCPMFAVFVTETIGGIWKALYCEANSVACRRYELFSKGKPVPAELLPDGRMLEASLAAMGSPETPPK
jgi:hypothetical protein